MDILIRGMEMPTNCLECGFYRRKDTIYDYCCISSATPKGYVPDDCPIVPVPPHGDLIERLDVIGYCDIPQECEDTFDSGVMWLAERIDELPTIIPASEERDMNCKNCGYKCCLFRGSDRKISAFFCEDYEPA